MKLSLNHINNLRIDVQKSGFEKILEKKIKEISNEIKVLQDRTYKYRNEFQQFDEKVETLIDNLKLNSLSLLKEEFKKIISNYEKIKNFYIQTV